MDSILSSKHQQEPQRQEQAQALSTMTYNREEEYRKAQRAAVEAVMIGRETLETAVRQGEQLQNAENMADETEYKLDKANRLLKNMTWSGWLANKFSRDVEPPEYKTMANSNDDDGAKSILGPPKVYEDVPDSCTSAAQAIQNYHANLQVLESCETDEQRETCKLICDNMFQGVCQQMEALRTSSTTLDSKTVKFVERLEQDKKTLRQRQLSLQQLHRGLTMTGAKISSTTDDKQMLLQHSKLKTNDDGQEERSPIAGVIIQQEQHLDTMAKHLHELGSLAGHLNTSLAEHSEKLDSLDEKNDSMLFKTKMVTRRADRIIQKKSWVKEKAEFVQYAWIRHQSSGRYLSVAPNNDSTLMLSGVLNERCIFGIWKRKRILGLQNKYSRKWAGQSLLGQLTCSGSVFGRREEWDSDDDWSNTTLIVASAGWGHGGYLLVDDNNGAVLTIGGGTLEDKKKAARFCIQPFEKN